MEGDVLSLSSSSSLPSSPTGATATQMDSSPKSDTSTSGASNEHKAEEELWTEEVTPAGGRLLSVEEQVTLITESMTVTSTDQEKVLLLNKNTELRRINKELMKLNDDWDQVYRSATMGLQHRLEVLEIENSAIKQLNSRLLLKVEHQQSAKEYYEQALMQELKKNQELQDYVRLIETRMHPPDRECPSAKQGSFGAVMPLPPSCPSSNPVEGPNLSLSHVSGYISTSSLFPPASSLEAELEGKSQCSSTPVGDSQQEVLDLKEQLEAMKCQIYLQHNRKHQEIRRYDLADRHIDVLCQQTQIYEAEYQTEHNDHKHTLQENRRLRRKRDEMRQQVALLQEQLKVYEDDFRRERSDKQMLQRLLLKKTPHNQDPVLIHRCNNEHQPLEGDKRTQSEERHHPERKQHHPLCPKHPDRDKQAH